MFDGWIRDFAAWTPRAPAVVTPAGATSYARFDQDIQRLASGLEQLGLSADTGVVSICLHDPYLTCVALCALARLRLTSSPYNDAGADLRLVQNQPGIEALAPGPRLLALDDAWIRATLASAVTRTCQPDAAPDQLVRVMLSSGTTGAPRRTPVTWSQIEAVNHCNLRSRCAGVGGLWASLTSVEVMQGFSIAISAWSVGAAFAPRVAANDLPAMFEAWPEGLLGCTPAQLRGVLQALPPGFQPCPGWRISIGGSRLPQKLAQWARMRLSPDLWVSYSATEAPITGLGRAADLDRLPGVVGSPVSGVELALLDDAGQPVPDGEPGELQIRGARVARGYLGDPEATAERFCDGWFRTRDVGRRLPDGRIVLEGRADDRMNLGGLKVLPAPLEEAALACDGVRDAAAFGAPGSEGGIDVCWLAIVTAPGFERRRLAAHLAAYPQLPPRRYAWVEDIPRNVMGKVERGKLRAAVLTALAAGGERV